MGDERRLWKLHREEVAREIRARRRPGGPRDETGHLAAFWRELGLDAARLVRVFGPSTVTTRKRKGVT